MKKAFSFLLSLLVVCAALPMTPVTAQAFDNFTQAYDAEYYAPASASFIYQIGLYYSSSSDEDAISHIESAGYTPFGGDFNAAAGGKFVHAGYKTTSDPVKALTAVRVWDYTAGGDNPDTPRDSATGTVNGSACAFYRVGSGASEWTPNVMDGDVNLNQGNSGHHLKLYVTTDRSAGLPLAALDTAHDKNEATAYNTLLNAGYKVATSFQAPLSYQDLNAGAGSNSDYNYLGFKAYAFTAVDSSALRSAYAAAKERYENGGSAYSFLSAPLTAAAAILTDLNDGFTSSTQAEIDAAASALGNALLYFTVTVSGGTCSGSAFKEGDSVTITANAPAAGKRFKEWTGADGLTFTSGDKTAATATFTMPAANVSLTATFEDIIYTITVSGGTCSGSAFRKGDSVTITANTPANGMQFKEWSGADGLTFTSGSKTAATATFTMPAANVNLTATYEEESIYTVSVGSNGHGIGFANPSSGTSGSMICLTATPDWGYRLARWEVISGGVQVFRVQNEDMLQIGSKNVVVKAIFEKIVYTVTLSPGEGTGEEIVFSSAAQTEIPTVNNAGYNMFYLENDGSMGFKFDSSICPAGWRGPDGKAFDGFLGAADYNKLSQENTVFTADWITLDNPDDVTLTSNITLDVDRIDADGFLPITIEFCNSDIGLAGLAPEAPLYMNVGSAEMTDGYGHALSFDVYTSDHSRRDNRFAFALDEVNHSHDLALKFDPTALANVYGEFNCEWVCSFDWEETGITVSNLNPKEAVISLQMEVKDQNTYSVTFTNTDGGTAYASPACGTAGTEVALTATPAEGWYFRKWEVVSGNVTLTGNTICIPHADVEIKAVFEEIATHTHSVTVTNTEGGTAYASAASGIYGTLVSLTAVPEHGYALKQWQVVSGGVTVTHNTFTIGDDDVEIRAVFAQESTYTLELPQSVTVTPGAVFTPVTGTVSDLYMIAGVNGKTPERLRIAFGAGTLTHQQDSSKTLAFESVYDFAHVPNENIVSFTSPGSKTSYLRIAGDRWSTAAPGTYTGSIPYRVFWLYTDNTTSKTLETGSIPVTVTIPAPGDVDCDGEVDLADVTLLTRYLAGGWNVTVDETIADVNKDGKVDLKDVVLIRRYLAGGWDVELQ